jgi:hypothetical protein
MNNPLIDLGSLAQPATVLIQKVCDAVGIVYEPMRIRRKAAADADAAELQALATIKVKKLELSALEERALHRLLRQESRKQENIESITAQAVEQLPSDAKPETLDEDWIAFLFANCSSVSEMQMQTVWARVLANEATAPKSFSRRTIQLLATMDQVDAQTFRSLAQFVWHLGAVPAALIYERRLPVYADAGLNFEALQRLEELGLISLTQSKIAEYSQGGYGTSGTAYYFGKVISFAFTQRTENSLPTGNVMLTRAGRELIGICDANRNDMFFQYVVDRWRSLGLNPCDVTDKYSEAASEEPSLPR